MCVTVTERTGNAIQDALYSVSGLGGIVRLEPGNYCFSDTISIPPLVSLMGSGMDVTNLRYEGAANAMVMPGTVSPEEPERNQRPKILLSGFALHGDHKGNVYGKIGIYGTYVSHAIIESVRVRAFDTGIYLEDSWENSLRQVVTDGNRVDGCRLGHEANNIVLFRCSSHANGRSGMMLQGARGSMLYGCNIEGNLLYGIYLVAGDGLTTRGIKIDGCYIEGNYEHEILLEGRGADQRLVGITVRDCYLVALPPPGDPPQAQPRASQCIRAHFMDGLLVDGCTFDDFAVKYQYSLYLPDNLTSRHVVWGTNFDRSAKQVHCGSGAELRR